MCESIKIWFVAVLLCILGVANGYALDARTMALIDAQIASHAGASGVYVLDEASEALLARAWLADNATRSIDIQYFIWSTDNVGILAAEALLRAAGRGVRVRVLVDDFLIDAPDKYLLALSRHPNIAIRIYNPRVKVGVPLQKRLLNLVTDFRGVNQRMHHKIVVVDGKIAITGGRNMADEYYDYDHAYNFRDRDILMLGTVVGAVQTSFEEFWRSPLSVKVEERFDGWGLMQKNVSVASAEIKAIYRELHAYAGNPANFAPEVRAAIADVPASFAALSPALTWAPVDFISDRPGKNAARLSLGGGGQATVALAKMVQSARTSIVIQSPYLVLSDAAMDLFLQARARGVSIRINTNSLASTDNLQAFSGYRNQRRRLLALGMQIHEYKPLPEMQLRRMQSFPVKTAQIPIFAVHAKTMVVDSKTVFIGTFNLDPRSENLNTEAGVIVHDAALARKVEGLIAADMAPGNSWNAATDNPDQYVQARKRGRVRLYQLLPMKPLL